MEKDDIPGLLRQAQEKDRRAAERVWDECRRAWGHALDWQKRAGRAFAEEGLQTDVLRQGIDAWIERERAALREKLRRLLG